MARSLKDMPQVASGVFFEARKLYDKTDFRNRYFEGLKNAQIFEMLLDTLFVKLVSIGSDYFKSIGLNYKPANISNMNISDYLIRIQTFFPLDENKSAYEKLFNAQNKRNKFIHHSFKTKKGNYFAINLDMDNIHQDQNAIQKLNEWETAFVSAFPILAEWASKINMIMEGHLK